MQFTIDAWQVVHNTLLETHLLILRNKAVVLTPT
jgi:hypothetical protein